MSIRLIKERIHISSFTCWSEWWRRCCIRLDLWNSSHFILFYKRKGYVYSITKYDPQSQSYYQKVETLAKDKYKTLLQKLFKRFRNKMTEEELLNEIKQRPLPKHFYRGFSTKDCFTPFGYIAPVAFLFKSTIESPRNDSYNEASINWDDERSLMALKTQINPKTREP